MAGKPVPTSVSRHWIFLLDCTWNEATFASTCTATTLFGQGSTECHQLLQGHWVALGKCIRKNVFLQHSLYISLENRTEIHERASIGAYPHPAPPPPTFLPFLLFNKHLPHTSEDCWGFSLEEITRLCVLSEGQNHSAAELRREKKKKTLPYKLPAQPLSGLVWEHRRRKGRGRKRQKLRKAEVEWLSTNNAQAVSANLCVCRPIRSGSLSA